MSSCHHDNPRRRRPLQEEAGFALLEVIVSAVILLIAVGASMALLDSSARTSVASRDRVTAADLADKDQERLRALPLTRLDAMTKTADAPQPITVGGANYTVQSSAKWGNDVAGFVPTCTSGTDGTSDYLQITSKVTPPANVSGVSGQTVSSLLSPKVSTVGSKGTLSVPFLDRDGKPLAGIVTTLTGTKASGNATSNVAGCSVFSYYPSGVYTATYSKTGYVTPSAQAVGTASPALVTTGRTNFTSDQRFDLAGRLTATVKTQNTSGATVNATPPVPPVSVSNSGIDNGTSIITQTPASTATSTVFSSLYPFTDPYAVFTGDCAANAPVGTATATVPRNGPATADAFAPTVILNAGTGRELDRVVVTATDAGCSFGQNVALAGVASISGQVPFGSYSVCAQDTADSSRESTRRSIKAIKLTAKAPLTVTMDTWTTTTTPCP